jgi:hypothetical protein
VTSWFNEDVAEEDKTLAEEDKTLAKRASQQQQGQQTREGLV